MSRGKYSPSLPTSNKGYEFFDRNAKGEIPAEYTGDISTFNEEIHFSNYDPEGFDSYGYSAYDSDGKFVGAGNGVDRLGNTEMDYLINFTDEEFYDL
jgi:hypothetical protein